MNDEDLRKHVIYELDRIVAELDAPFSNGRIARSIATQLRGVVREWLDVYVSDRPYIDVVGAHERTHPEVRLGGGGSGRSAVRDDVGHAGTPATSHQLTGDDTSTV